MAAIPELLKESESPLCIGLDPRVSMDRRLAFSKRIVDLTADYAIAYKPNIQFWHGSSASDLRSLTGLIHDHGLPVIADLKISDIGSSNRAALENMKSLGFDYVTHSPFPGNLSETSETAEEVGIGIITLVVMSNPQAKWMVESGMYLTWAKEVEQYAAGAVLGTTNHVTTEVLQELAKIMKSPFILAPGIGSQGGQTNTLSELFPKRVIFNVSRGINQADDPKAAAKSYYELIKHDL